jgi:hypothetical protein
VYSRRCKHMPADDERVSAGICFQVDFSVMFASAGICISKGVPSMLPYPYEPEPLVGVPLPAGRLDHRSQVQIGGGDPDRDLGLRGEPRLGRFPVGFFDYQFDSLQPLPRLGIIPVAHADQSGAVFHHQPFSPSLPRFENQTSFHAALR